MEEDYVVVPKRDLEKLEESRVKLYRLLEEQCKDTFFLAHLTDITGPIWYAANRNYPLAVKQN